MHRSVLHANLVECTQGRVDCRATAKYRYRHCRTAQEIHQDNDGPSIAGAKPQQGSVHARMGSLVPRVPFSGALRS